MVIDKQTGEVHNAVAIIESDEALATMDDNQIIAQMTGAAVQEYVYSFRQGGKVVEGLTLAGINEAANRRGGIRVELVDKEDRDKSWLVIVKATDTRTGSERLGAFEQAKQSDGRSDPFAFTKAVHKAQRNAIKQLLPVPIIKQLIQHYLHGGSRPNDAVIVEVNNEKPVSGVRNSQKAAFALATELQPRLDEFHVTKEMLWQWVKERYCVASRREMQEAQWVELAAELRAAKSSDELLAVLVDTIRGTGQEVEF